MPTTFVDEQAERRHAGLLIALGVAFLVAGWSSWTEWRYLTRGRSVDADVTRLFEFSVPTRSGRSQPRLGIDYRFRDADGIEHEDRDWVSLPSELQGAVRVRVQYLPGAPGDSRLAANRAVLGPVLFVGCLVGIVVVLVRFAREAHEPIRRGRRSGPVTPR